MSEVEQFATKYRSKSIDEYVGNDYVKTTILRRFLDEPYPQTIMIEGESGCGKTTMGRLLAKHIVCEHKKRVTVEGQEMTLPCNECETCILMDKFIQDGDSDNLYNVTELDSSVSRRAESIDEFISEASVPSMYGGHQVYIIDECHMISKTGQTSFLKFLEDVPEGKIFIFCTTDRDKVLETLVNRCKLILTVRKPTLENVVQVLQNIADAEGISYEVGALKLIAERSGYVYRSAINNFENVFRGYKTVTVSNTADALDIQTLDVFFDFFNYLLSGNVVMYVHMLHIIKIGSGFKVFYENLREFVKRGLYVKNGIPIEGLTDSEINNFSKLFKEFSLEEVYSLLNFIDSAKEGDLETKLFILGYRGLHKLETPTEKEEVEVRDNDLANEKQVQQVFKTHQAEVKRELTEEEAGEDLKDLTLEDMASMFKL